MAFSPQQIAPIDFDASTAVGVNIPLNGPAVFISNYQTKDAIKNNLINFIIRLILLLISLIVIVSIIFNLSL